MKYSAQEIRAAAETALTASNVADAAKKALDANPDDASLKTAYETAQAAATTAKQKADELSQESTLSPDQIAKMKRKRAIIDKELRDAGALDDTDDDLGEDDEDDNAPITRGDLKRMKAEDAKQSAVQMANAITDVAARQAVVDALGRVVASGDPEKDFKDAVAIANRERNNKILEEIQRKPAGTQFRNGAGAPPRPAEGEFTPSAEEARFMKPPFNLTKDAIIKAREAAQS